MAIIDRFFVRAFKRGTLQVTYADGSVRTFGAPDPEFPDIAIRFADRATPGRILRDPSLGLAEAFIEGRATIERGDIMGLLALATANNRWEAATGALDPNAAARTVTWIRRKIDQYNRTRVSRQNVKHHYDIGNALYDLFLDADRQYSCAYFLDPGESLEQAQLDKKAHIAAKLALTPGMRVLDIGCGWGGMALYLHQTYGVDVLGITLSDEQIKTANQRAADAGVADHVKFALTDYREQTGSFDRIVSVGMFEHVGPPQYRTFFKKCRDLLTEDGVMLVHTIGRAGGPGVTDEFTARYIFPGGYIPALSEIAKGYEGLRYYMTDCEVLRLHYAYTLQTWYDRAVANKDKIVAMYDETFFRMWTFYLAGSCVSFRYGGMVNYQLQFARNRHALPITRDYMLAEERRIAGKA
ncbi:cyclopropane-fatty-acyl-phospholipid synthase family protein [Sphingomonas sp.]|jgi:cyclopropane-fatty-acyl-phospholipid synthase|uniref:cyclopropane-fatty-acyl-phospholipid synthase family protein n=1 Tax=Sphingomonas sp. TaxID=28214 RepID=UPI002E34C83E|nr:cyclopropane-fatty-acyl-phospholipid synthase family protein [Sphingomonas sp.]HEX4695738.1 cyclopropane-fatty-acyl-phospholipid synthase family protein [Sphingomonas sp.]